MQNVRETTRCSVLACSGWHPPSVLAYQASAEVNVPMARRVHDKRLQVAGPRSSHL